MLRDVTRVDDGAESSWRQTASATFGVAYLPGPGPARPGRLLAEESPQASSSFRFLVFYAVFKVTFEVASIWILYFSFSIPFIIDPLTFKDMPIFLL